MLSTFAAGALSVVTPSERTLVAFNLNRKVSLEFSAGVAETVNPCPEVAVLDAILSIDHCSSLPLLSITVKSALVIPDTAAPENVIVPVSLLDVNDTFVQAAVATMAGIL